MATNEVATADEAKALPSGQWVQDTNGKAWCLIDTHMGFPQRMGMHGNSLVSLESLAYPLHLGDFVGECEHRWGTHELGNCVRCGVVVAEARPVFFDEGTQKMMHAVAESNARAESNRGGDTNE
jgi:hypothetical protein